MNKLIPIGAIIIVVGIGILLSQNKQPSPSQTAPAKNDSMQKETTTKFANPKKSAHYESNTPAHGTTLAAVPINVVIDFNFDLAANSSIEIHAMAPTPKIGGNDFCVEKTIIDFNKLSMRCAMDPVSPDGIYSVAYKACWPDGSCHDGYFQFAIDRAKTDTYTDFRGKKDVTVDLADITFVPQNIRISRGTKVTWTNSDSVEHYINTDSHPAHTYYPSQNSKALKKGDTYSITFDNVGEYPYHCSAHADSMVGTIVVE